jgi:putative nucleotidyltransferase with HDIG domain
MLQDKIKKRLARKLQDTHLRQLIGQEIITLLADKPDDVPAEEYCLSVAEIVVHELKDRLCKPIVEDTEPPPCDTMTKADQTPNLNGIIKRLTVGVEKALLSGNLQMLRALGEAIAKRDTGNICHNPRVALLVTRMAEFMGLESEQVQALIKGAFLHDIGKIGIQDDILLKPSGLTDEERKLMNSHTEMGAAIIGGVKWLTDAMDVVRNHHERWDGKGYPDRLAGDAIPLNARLFAVVDVFDALTSERPYKKAFPFDKSVIYICEGSGTHFDPEIVEAFTVQSNVFYDELANQPYPVLNSKLQRSMSLHFGMDMPTSAGRPA